jgi:transcriptional regulator with XRE-family HTH domain
MTESTFGQLLATYRKQKNLTLEKLGKEALVSPGYISLLIRGQKGRPSDEIIERLAKALKLTKEEHSQLLQAAEETDRSRASSYRSMTPSAAGISAVLNEEFLELLFRDQASRAENLIRIQDIWLAEPISYVSTLREALSTHKPNLRIQILLLNPTDEHISEMRQAALGIASNNHIRNQLSTAIHEFKAVRESLGHNCKQFEVRTFHTVPSILQIVCDEISYIGFYLYGKQSQRANQLEIDRLSPLGRLFDEEFDNVWNADTTKTVVPE